MVNNKNKDKNKKSNSSNSLVFGRWPQTTIDALKMSGFKPDLNFCPFFLCLPFSFVQYQRKETVLIKDDPYLFCLV